jgi:hypothetical protein
MSTTKAFIIAHLPPELQQEWLQHVRDFDTAHPGCHFEIGVDLPPDAPPIAEAVDMLRVDPALTFTKIYERKAASAPGPGAGSLRTKLVLLLASLEMLGETEMGHLTYAQASQFHAATDALRLLVEVSE